MKLTLLATWERAKALGMGGKVGLVAETLLFSAATLATESACSLPAIPVGWDPLHDQPVTCFPQLPLR